jgi:aryl-alcohol dehydrogenase-like predicted oxidoreductase
MWCGLGRALPIGVSEWTPQHLRAGPALARELKISFVSNQSKYNAHYRVQEPEVVPTCQELGIGQICFSPYSRPSSRASTGRASPSHRILAPPTLAARSSSRAS